jgi:hypothetical protein
MRAAAAAALSDAVSAAGRVPVVRKLGRGVGAMTDERWTDAQRTGDLAVQPQALSGQRALVDRVAQKRVAERVRASVPGREQQVMLGGLLQRAEQLGLWARDHGREQPVVDRAADHRGRAQHLARRGGKPLDPEHERLAQRWRQRAAGRVGAREQLLDEEWVAFRAAEDRLDQVPLRCSSDDLGDLLGHVVELEP